MSGLRKAVVFCAAVTVALGAASVEAAKDKTPATKKPSRVAGPAPAKQVAKAATPASPVADKLTYSGPPVLEPGQFFGAAAMGYAAAKVAPEVMAKLFCYCGCDLSDSHNALIDCFTGNHGVDCHICQEEAVLALRMHRDGASIAEIQKRVDNDYSRQYPFETKSDALKKYESTRGGATAAATPGLAPTNAPDCPVPEKAAAKPKVKPGMTVGNCCGEGHDKKK